MSVSVKTATEIRCFSKKIWTWEISLSTEYSEGLEISEGSYKSQNGSKSMCFLGSEFLENGSRSFWFQSRVCFACKHEIQACHKEAQHTDKSHEPYSERLYNRERMKGITEVRKLIWFQCMLLCWTIIGAECGHFEGEISKTVFETFLNESISVSYVGVDLYIKSSRRS